MTSEWDCVVVGGGAAGLSAGLVLARARRRTLLLDIGGQSNRVAEGIGGLLGNDRRPPAEFYAAGREEIAAYDDVEVRDAEVADGERLGATTGEPDGERLGATPVERPATAADPDHRFALSLADGETALARRVLLATGMDYRYPDLPGARERWGRSVFHCPFCHGWEVRGQDLAVLGGDEMAVHRALLLTSWSESVTLLSDGAEIAGEAAGRLAAAGVGIDDRAVASLQGPGSSLSSVVFEDGSERALGGLLVGVTLHRRSDLPGRLGAATAPASPITAEAVEVDATMNAGVPGLYAAGDLLPHPPSVPAAIASGQFAAAQVVGSLTA
jgi:thioredoxin reductase